MNDWGMSVISQYNITLRSVRKVRGALLCDAKEGTYLLQQYRGKHKRLQEEANILSYLEENGTIHTDRILKNENGELLSKNEEGTGYVLKVWYPWQECNVKSIGDLGQAVNTLARLHVHLRCMPCEYRERNKKSIPEDMPQQEEIIQPEEMTNTHVNAGEQDGQAKELWQIYEKHNRELRRVKTYLSKKKKKSVLEQLIQKNLPDVYEQAEKVENKLKSCGLKQLEEEAKRKRYLVHGAYHQHNVLIGSGQTAIVNFEQYHEGCQIIDLYQFLRKVMEKHNWDAQLGKSLISEYCRIQHLSDDELLLLSLMIAYPEKYWKQVNFYYNNNKSWIAEKNIEKIQKAVEQNSVRTAFADLLLNR